MIFEDENGIWIRDDQGDQLLDGKFINLPDFTESPNAAVLRILHHEILINIVDGKPLPNLLTYSEPWYRDAAMMCRVLQKTGNLSLVKDWILDLSEPYDGQAGINEPDNLGQALYLISLVSDSSHPLVKEIIAEAETITVNGHLTGMTDGAQHTVYQTAWMKYGLHALKLEDHYVIPVEQDTYAHLLWWYPDLQVEDSSPLLISENFPYLTWAEDHLLGTHNASMGDQPYPLSWERMAGMADPEQMQIIDPIYSFRRTSAPHGWTAAEMFLYLIE